MSKELRLLNLLCVVVAIGFVALAVLNLLTSGDLLTTDNLFVTMVCLVMALMFAVNPLLYLKSEGKLPIPLMKSSPSPAAQVSGAVGSSAPLRGAAPAVAALLDTKGRAVPPDVRAIVSRLGQTPKDG